MNLIKENMRVFLIGFFVFLAVQAGMFGFVSLAQAQESEGLSVAPGVIEDSADPGQVFNFSVKVTNNGAGAKELFLMKRDIKSVTDGGSPVFVEEGLEATGLEISSWIVLPVESVWVEAGETKKVDFVVNVPEDASPGSHFGGIFFSQQAPEMRESGVSIGYQVGSIINLRISGEVLEEARLRTFTTGKMIYDRGEVDFNVKVDNLGNVLLRPHGFVEIKDMFGKEVGKVRVNEEASGVFPKLDREFEFSWISDGFAFGRYQALLSVVYGQDSKKTLSGVLSFWVLPKKPIAIFFGSIFALILFIFLFVRMYVRKKMKEMRAMALSSARRQGGGAAGDLPQHKPVSKLAIVGVTLLLFVVVFLVLLFFLFA